LVFAVIYAVYSFAVYMFRRRSIESREVDGHYDDAWGPSLLVLFLVLYLLGALLIQYSPIAAIINPKPLPPPHVQTFSWRLAFNSTIDPLKSLSEIIGAIQQRASVNSPLTGSFGDPLVQSAVLFDTLSCSLRKNGYFLQLTRPSSSVGDELLSLDFSADDVDLIETLNASKKGMPSRRFSYQTIFLQAQDSLFSLSETTATFRVMDLQRVQSISRLFPDFQMWKFIPFIDWTKNVNSLISNSLTLTTRKGIHMVKLPNAELVLRQWLVNATTPIYSELQINCVLPVQEDSSPAMITINNLFDDIRGMSFFSTRSSDPISAIYKFANLTC
jgi:hypothetical protein